MTTIYLKNVNTMMDLFLSYNVLTPKVIMSGENFHLRYIITNLARDSYNFGTSVLQYYIQSLTHHATMYYI